MSGLLLTSVLIIVLQVSVAAVIYVSDGRRGAPDLERTVWTAAALAAPLLGFLAWILLRGIPRRGHRTRISPR